MAVLSLDVGMSSSENDQTNDSNHENNLYADRQLQNRLLQVEEDSDMAEYDQKLSKSWSNLKPKLSRSDTRIDSINGWFPNVKFVARKTEGSQRPETKPTFIHPWKDYRSKKEDSFVFKHYTDCRNYIEQYRNEHGCHGSRYPSGIQIGDMRRVAFQGTAPPQHSPITVQQMQQSGYSTVSPQSANNQSSLHYASRKEQLGTLITGSTTANNSAGKRTNYIDSSSHAQKYRVNNTNGKLPRNNTVFDLRNADSDNSSEGGVDVRLRSPSRRSNSASSTRTKSRNTTKSPTKITVPASSNPRSYPLQALTIQQNGKPPDICPSPKPLDNLNCVAPEKQSNSNERKPLEQPSLELALRVHSLNDLLVANEAPLRGYALPKSLPPNPNNTSNSDEGSACSDTDSDDIISLGQLSTCPLSADMRVRIQNDQNSDNLQKFLKEDPMLRSLNTRPELRPTSENQNFNSASKWLDNEAMIPHNDIDAMLRVNMWNPILSAVQPNGYRKERSNVAGYRTMMTQSPFRSSYEDPSILQKSTDSEAMRTPFSERVDFFNPVKNVRLSITRLDNAVSFCQTHTPGLKKDGIEKRPGHLSRATNSASTSHSFMGRVDSGCEHFHNVKMKPPLYDPFTEKINKPTKFEQKLNMPLPKVKILESVPVKCDSPDKNQENKTDNKNESRTNSQDQTAHKKTNEEHKNITLSEHQTIGIPDQPKKEIEAPKVSPRNTSAIKVKDNLATDSPKASPRNVTAGKEDIVLNGESTFGKKDKEKKGSDKNTGPGNNKERSENVAEKLSNDSEKGTGTVLDGLKGVRININDKKQTKAEQAMENARNKTRKMLKKPALASGKCFKRDQEFEGMTWSEKLEALRSVNKPPEKVKSKQPKLKFVKAEPTDAMFVLSVEHNRLNEQRRIRHLVEQARLKGGKQFDWVYEAQVKSRDIDWEGVMESETDVNVTDSVMIDRSTGELTEHSAGAGDNLGRIYSPSVKQIKQTLINSRNLDKSNTSVTQ